MGKLLFFHFRVTNSKLKKNFIQKIKEKNFEVVQDFFIEMKYTNQNYLKKS